MTSQSELSLSAGVSVGFGKTEERDFRCLKWGESENTKEGGGGGSTIFRAGKPSKIPFL